MGHGHGLLALVLKLHLVLFLTQLALALGGGPPPPGVDPKKSGGSSAEPALPTPVGPPNSSLPSISTPPLSQLSTSSASSSTALSSPVSSQSSPSPSKPLLSSSSSSTFTPTPSSDSTASPSTSQDSSPSPVYSTTERSTPDAGTAPTVSPLPSPSPSSGNDTVLSSSHSNNHVPIIAGVVAPVVFIVLAAIGFVLYKRRQRAADRREWERTHEAIADAVRQVNPGRSITPYAGSGAWNHLDMSSKASGDTVTNPYVDRPVSHQSAENFALPVFRAVHSPTLRAAHSPTLSQSYTPFHVQDESESRHPSMESSAQADTSYGYHDEGHAI